MLLFVRPSNGVYLPPQMLHLTGKSTVVEIGVKQKDMPNFFVEAATISDGRVHTEVREIYVPPAQARCSTWKSSHRPRPTNRASTPKSP